MPDEPRRREHEQGAELVSGDYVLVDVSGNEIYLSVDDVDDSMVPTARLTPAEAEQLSLRLARAAQRARWQMRLF